MGSDRDGNVSSTFIPFTRRTSPRHTRESGSSGNLMSRNEPKSRKPDSGVTDSRSEIEAEVAGNRPPVILNQPSEAQNGKGDGVDILKFTGNGSKPARKKSWVTVPPSPKVAEADAESDSSTSQEFAQPIRTKRQHPRPPHLRLKTPESDFSRPRSIVTPTSKTSGELTVPFMESSSEVAVTPKATEFSSGSPDSPQHHVRVRKNSKSNRSPARKVPPSPVKGNSGEDGDDEGYDEFLSAYESEDSVHTQVT